MPLYSLYNGRQSCGLLEDIPNCILFDESEVGTHCHECAPSYSDYNNG